MLVLLDHRNPLCRKRILRRSLLLSTRAQQIWQRPRRVATTSRKVLTLLSLIALPALLYLLCQLCCAHANAKKSRDDLAEGTHFTQFTCCPRTEVQILTQLLAEELKNAQRVRREAYFSVYLLYWYNSTNNDADIRPTELKNAQARAQSGVSELERRVKQLEKEVADGLKRGGN